MGSETEIAWTDHTFNPWWGCVRVSPGCTNCYAETWDRRWGGEHWGPLAPRRFFGDAHWNEPRKWNRDAEAAGVRRRVFCASMADVFEDRRDLDEQRDRLWRLISETPRLDWQLLTKRPENMGRLAPWRDYWPSNAWAGTTVEDQQRADERVFRLLEVPARVRFLSVEPMLGPVDLTRVKTNWIGVNGFPSNPVVSAFGKWQTAPMRALLSPMVHWVIVGGESGHGARPFDLAWARSVVAQCKATGTACFVKQLGAVPRPSSGVLGLWRLKDRKGGDPDEWPEDLRVRQFPTQEQNGNP